MNNPQYNIKESYHITEHWELWETQINKLKSYLPEIAKNEYAYIAKNEFKKEQDWQEKTNKKLK